MGLIKSLLINLFLKINNLILKGLLSAINHMK